MVALATALLLPLGGGVARAAPAGSAEPRVERLVDEDARVQVEEVRVRGETQRLVVRPKLPGAPAYEIRPGAGGRDPSSAQGRVGGAGERVWRLLSF